MGALPVLCCGDRAVGRFYFWFPRSTVTLCLALINVTGTFHPQVPKGLSVSFEPGCVWGGIDPGPAGSGLRHKHGSRMFHSLAMPSPGVSVNLLAPTFGGLAAGQGRVAIVSFVFQKGKSVHAEMEKNNKKRLDHG